MAVPTVLVADPDLAGQRRQQGVGFRLAVRIAAEAQGPVVVGELDAQRACGVQVSNLVGAGQQVAGQRCASQGVGFRLAVRIAGGVLEGEAQGPTSAAVCRAATLASWSTTLFMLSGPVAWICKFSRADFGWCRPAGQTGVDRSEAGSVGRDEALSCGGVRVGGEIRNRAGRPLGPAVAADVRGVLGGGFERRVAVKRWRAALWQLDHRRRSVEDPAGEGGWKKAVYGEPQGAGNSHNLLTAGGCTCAAPDPPPCS